MPKYNVKVFYALHITHYHTLNYNFPILTNCRNVILAKLTQQHSKTNNFYFTENANEMLHFTMWLKWC